MFVMLQHPLSLQPDYDSPDEGSAVPRGASVVTASLDESNPIELLEALVKTLNGHQLTFAAREVERAGAAVRQAWADLSTVVTWDWRPAARHVVKYMEATGTPPVDVWMEKSPGQPVTLMFALPNQKRPPKFDQRKFETMRGQLGRLFQMKPSPVDESLYTLPDGQRVRVSIGFGGSAQARGGEKLAAVSASRVASLHMAGGSDFTVFVRGTNAENAFYEARSNAESEARADAEENGDNYEGYSGTIAEKSDFVMRGQGSMTKEEAFAFAEKDLNHNDKWGPAFCIPVATEGQRSERVEVKVMDVQRIRSNKPPKYSVFGMATEQYEQYEPLLLDKARAILKIPAPTDITKSKVSITYGGPSQPNSRDPNAPLTIGAVVDITWKAPGKHIMGHLFYGIASS